MVLIVFSFFLNFPCFSVQPIAKMFPPSQWAAGGRPVGGQWAGQESQDAEDTAQGTRGSGEYRPALHQFSCKKKLGPLIQSLIGELGKKKVPLSKHQQFFVLNFIRKRSWQATALLR